MASGVKSGAFLLSESGFPEFENFQNEEGDDDEGYPPGDVVEEGFLFEWFFHGWCFFVLVGCSNTNLLL